MPWDHCDVEFILDDEDCPTCGISKAAWTVDVNQTRTLQIGKRASASWGEEQAKRGDEVRLIVRHPRQDTATLEIFAEPQDPKADPIRLGSVDAARGESGDLEATWTTHLTPDPKTKAEPNATLFFLAHLDRGVTSSGRESEALLQLVEDLDLVLLDPHSNRIADCPCRVTLSDGSVRDTATDGEGRLVLEAIPLGRVSFQFEERHVR